MMQGTKGRPWLRAGARAWSSGLVLPLLLGTGGLVAQEPVVRSLPLVLQVPGSTRALSLGDAYHLGQTDADAGFYNPGLLDTSRGVSASFARYGSGSTLFTAAWATDWFRGGVGLGLQTLSYGALSGDAGAFTRGEAGLSTSGAVSGTEQVLTAAYARTKFGLRLGIAGKLIDQRMAGERDLTVAADVGVAKNLGVVTVGLAARNLGRDPTFEAFDAQLPATITLAGASRTTAVGPLDVSLAASTSWLRGDRWAAGGGLEVAWWPVTGRTFIARAGYRWREDTDMRPLTVGAGFSGDRIVLDYAFQDADGGSPVHRVTMRFR
jgi:hypothetical protein